MITVFKKKLFPLYSENYYEEFKEESSESEGVDEILNIDTSEQVNKLDEF